MSFLGFILFYIFRVDIGEDSNLEMLIGVDKKIFKKSLFFS